MAKLTAVMMNSKYTRDYEKNNLPENCRKVVLQRDITD